MVKQDCNQFSYWIWGPHEDPKVTQADSRREALEPPEIDAGKLKQ